MRYAAALRRNKEDVGAIGAGTGATGLAAATAELSATAETELLRLRTGFVAIVFMAGETAPALPFPPMISNCEAFNIAGLNTTRFGGGGGGTARCSNSVASSERVLVGAQGTYEARCRHCFDPRLGQ